MIKVIWPYNIDLKYWAACLVSDFPNDNLPELKDEQKWQQWGAIVADTGTFKNANIPSPVNNNGTDNQKSFNDWQKWAKIVYISLADEYKTSNNQT